MSEDCLFNNTIEQREFILQMLGCSYEIPVHLRDCVATGIRYLSTKNYSDETINQMVEKPMTLADSLSSLGSTREGDLSLFRGKFLEWLVCMEYNALKNKGNLVMTIVNPDPSSKADLLHIIDTGDGYQCVAGPDVKSGNAYYVFNQWEKILENRREIPMIDADGLFANEEKLQKLYPKIWKRYHVLKEKYPGKKPLPTTWRRQDVMRITMDYLVYVGDGMMPSEIGNKPFPENYTKKANCDKIKAKVKAEAGKQTSIVSWEEYAIKAKFLMNNSSNVSTVIGKEFFDVKAIHDHSKIEQKDFGNIEEQSEKSTAKFIKWVSDTKCKLDAKATSLGYSSFADRMLNWSINALEYGPIILDLIGGICTGKSKSKQSGSMKSDKSNTTKVTTMDKTGKPLTKHQNVRGHYAHRNTKQGRVLRPIKPYSRGPKEQ